MIEFTILSLYFLVPFALVVIIYEYVIKPIKSFVEAFKGFGDTY
jgi:hypothetical protein